MKPLTNIYQLKKGISFLFLIAFSIYTFGQGAEKKLSGGVGMGIPITFFTVNSSLVGLYMGNVRYSFNKALSLEARLTSNVFLGKTNNPPKTVLDGSVSDLVRYRTAMYGLHGMVYYNLHNFFGLLSPESNWLPYVNAGAGLHIYKPSVTLANGYFSQGQKFGKPCRDYQFGAGTRYFLNSTIDLNGGIEYHFVETYYLDGIIGPDKKLDNFLNIYAGVNIKFGAKPWDNLVDWSHKNVENPKESAKNYSKWAADVTLGIPYMFTPVGHSLTGMFSLGIRHSFSKSMGLQLAYHHGNLSGGQDIVPLVVSRYSGPENVKTFSTKINQYTVRAYFNIRNLTSESASRTEWNHYAILGGGFIYGNQDVTFADNTTATKAKVYLKGGVQNIVAGYEARKYLMHNLDLIAGADFSLNQSKYFDAAPAKTGLNSHLYFHTGVTYKIGTSKDKEHIDWSYVSYNNYKDKSIQIEQVPVIEKPITEEAPKIDTSMAVAPPVVEPTPVPPVVEPTPVEPPVVAPVIPEPVVAPTPTPTPVPTPAPTRTVRRARPAPGATTSPRTSTPSTYVATDDVTPPPTRYNVIVACYSVNRLNIAQAYKVKLEKNGYSPSIYRSSTNSRMLRMSVISTADRGEALNTLRRARKELEPESWIYIYNKQ